MVVIEKFYVGAAMGAIASVPQRSDEFFAPPWEPTPVTKVVSNRPRANAACRTCGRLPQIYHAPLATTPEGLSGSRRGANLPGIQGLRRGLPGKYLRRGLPGKYPG